MKSSFESFLQVHLREAMRESIESRKAEMLAGVEEDMQRAVSTLANLASPLVSTSESATPAGDLVIAKVVWNKSDLLKAFRALTGTDVCARLEGEE